jgi:hypothetical protein
MSTTSTAGPGGLGTAVQSRSLLQERLPERPSRLS